MLPQIPQQQCQGITCRALQHFEGIIEGKN
jgi:hypothetical protein